MEINPSFLTWNPQGSNFLSPQWNPPFDPSSALAEIIQNEAKKQRLLVATEKISTISQFILGAEKSQYSIKDYKTHMENYYAKEVDGLKIERSLKEISKEIEKKIKYISRLHEERNKSPRGKSGRNRKNSLITQITAHDTQLKEMYKKRETLERKDGNMEKKLAEMLLQAREVLSEIARNRMPKTLKTSLDTGILGKHRVTVITPVLAYPPTPGAYIIKKQELVDECNWVSVYSAEGKEQNPLLLIHKLLKNHLKAKWIHDGTFIAQQK